MQSSSSIDLQAYTDVDWASCPNDLKSMGGCYVFLGSNLISWSFTKQLMVSWSNVESKHQGLAFVIIETMWIQLVLEELCIPQSAPPLVWCDNQSAAYFASNPVFHAWLKHIKLDLHFI